MVNLYFTRFIIPLVEFLILLASECLCAPSPTDRISIDTMILFSNLQKLQGFLDVFLYTFKDVLEL